MASVLIEHGATMKTPYLPHFILLLLALTCNTALACMMPFYGPEFDKHVIVEVVDQSSLTFQVSAPLTIFERNVESAWLAYYEKPFEGFDQPRFPVHFDEIKLKRDGDRFVGEVRLAKLQPEQFATVRFHLDGMCGAIAEALIQPIQSEARSAGD